MSDRNEVGMGMGMGMGGKNQDERKRPGPGVEWSASRYSLSVPSWA